MEEEIKKEILGKAGFPIYVDYWDKYFSLMSGDQVKEVLEIVFHFNKTYEVKQSKDLSVVMVVNTIIDNLKRDGQKRIKKSKSSRGNGLLGGRPKKEPKGAKPKKPKVTQGNPEEPNGLLIPDFIDVETWNNYVQMRKEIKKPLTESIAQGCIKNLTKFEDKKTGNANLSLDNSIAGGYQGLFEPKEDFNKPKSNLGWLNK
jgi:hypothetical protein